MPQAGQEQADLERLFADGKLPTMDELESLGIYVDDGTPDPKADNSRPSDATAVAGNTLSEFGHMEDYSGPSAANLRLFGFGDQFDVSTYDDSIKRAGTAHEPHVPDTYDPASWQNNSEYDPLQAYTAYGQTDGPANMDGTFCTPAQLTLHADSDEFDRDVNADHQNPVSGQRKLMLSYGNVFASNNVGLAPLDNTPGFDDPNSTEPREFQRKPRSTASAFSGTSKVSFSADDLQDDATAGQSRDVVSRRILEQYFNVNIPASENPASMTEGARLERITELKEDIITEMLQDIKGSDKPSSIEFKSAVYTALRPFAVKAGSNRLERKHKPNPLTATKRAVPPRGRYRKDSEVGRR